MKPILFNSEMVRAVLSGRKTQTRRAIKLANAGYCDPKEGTYQDEYGETRSMFELCPYGQVGDRLWVRETWRPHCWDSDFFEMLIEYAADGQISEWIATSDLWCDENRCEDVWIKLSNDLTARNVPVDADGNFEKVEVNPLPWRPSIFLPRAASRITLEITNVRIERVQSIKPSDAIAEGITFEQHGGGLGDACDEIRMLHAFESLWDKINSRRGYGWELNPWAWVVEFSRIV